MDRLGIRRRKSPGLQVELPFKAALLSADEMEALGPTLARSHRLSPRQSRDELLSRLSENEAVLRSISTDLSGSASPSRRLTPAAEWLVDNFHLIDDQIATAKRHLPRGYSRELPNLLFGASAGLPRVYDLALASISHSDGRLDEAALKRFVTAYQTVSPLNIGELWAIPIMLRIALIENLRRGAVRIAAARADRDLATAWADCMILVAERDPKGLILEIADMARSNPPMKSAFVAEFARRLQGASSALALALTWVELLLAESDLTIEQMVQAESQAQASGQVSISNSILSLRYLGGIDWRDFVESISAVHGILGGDPARIYGQMDFITRDRYRHAVEAIARNSRFSEIEVAQMAADLSREAAVASGPHSIQAHLGYFLADRGLPVLQRRAEVRRASAEIDAARPKNFPVVLYLGSAGTLTALVLAALMANAGSMEWPAGVVALLLLSALITASEIAFLIVNYVVTIAATPNILPRMDYANGIPPVSRTLVVVPSMLTSRGGVDDLVEGLEIRFLANSDPNIHFALLTDFVDAPQEWLEGDKELLQWAETRIGELNAKYAHVHRSGSDRQIDDSGDTHRARAGGFFLFHRPRRWNAREGVWMGEERKRGKLADLNGFLRGGGVGMFASITGDQTLLGDVRYVITLDTDTDLPLDSARQMISAMAHPLNAPRFEVDAGQSESGIVTSGYGILQPRVAHSLAGAGKSRFARLHSGEAGIDPYTRAVSDVYQDLFSEGSFIGKGIYDVDAFERALKHRLPPNRVLSHDLIEGCYARSGLLSDAQLYEEFPAKFSADAARRRRWIRGDWQLVGWLRRTVPGPSGKRVPNPLSLLSQWKLLDNLRRSLVPVALLFLLASGWTYLPNPAFWTAYVLVVLVLPYGVSILTAFAGKPAGVHLGLHLLDLKTHGARAMTQGILAVAWLPYEAWLSVEAIVRTVTRMLVTRRRLLEWRPASGDRAHFQARSDSSGLAASFRAMAVAPAIALAIALVVLAHPDSFTVAVPIVLLWVLSPALAWWLSEPIPRRESGLTAAQVSFLRQLARRTWGFFDTYAGEGDSWLAPDNVQFHPATKVAHRTSPTNIGLALLSNVAAYDFGYVSMAGVLQRCGNTLQSMETLERHRGHFYNWYDTESRQPLAPKYVSTVDSGNLVGHLLTLRSALAELRDAPVLNPRWLEGLADTVALLGNQGSFDRTPAFQELNAMMASVAARRPQTLVEVSTFLESLGRTVTKCAAMERSHAELPGDDAEFWMQALLRQIRDARDDLHFLCPWLEMPDDELAGLQDASVTLRLCDIALIVPNIQPPGDSAGPSTRTPGDAALPHAAIATSRRRASERLAHIADLRERITACASADFTFLYNKVRRHLTIGFNVAAGVADDSHYDLLASEARLCNFVAIAEGQLPQESWFALGRRLNSRGGEPVLQSWSGSMFEYLMPLVVMPNDDATLLGRTCRAAVRRHIEYGQQRGVPWGVSESGYNAVDSAYNYQYRAFGVPGLGIKRGLADELVVAPYASALALMVMPEEACSNLQRLAKSGLDGRFGLYEAVDYTPSRNRRGEPFAVVRSYMAHHQGMTLLSLVHALLDEPMQKRFLAEPRFQAALQLLHEKVPRPNPDERQMFVLAETAGLGSVEAAPARLFNTPNTPTPHVNLLSNGAYHVMITNAGGGYSRWRDVAVTRWREDGTTDHWGSFCYLREVATGAFWSSAFQPTLKVPDHYEAIFSEGRAEFRRRDHGFEAHTEIVVSPEDNIEIRRLRICNRGQVTRAVEVTSYAEVVLGSAAADALHPAFAKLFVQTEIITADEVILCTRRPRSANEQPAWAFHLMVSRAPHAGDATFETDRARFIGRGNTLADPAAMAPGGALSGTAGSVLDPIVAIRHIVSIAAGATVVIDMVTGVGESRESVLQLSRKYRDRGFADRVFELTWTHSQVSLRQLNASEHDAQLYTDLAGSVLYASARLRAEPSTLSRNRRGQSGLWGYAISGDLPIVLLQIADAANIELVQQLVQAHAYWRLKGLAVDLVIWNEERTGYRNHLQEQIVGLIAAGVEAHLVDRPGGIFVRHAEQISEDDRVLFQSVARAIISDDRGTLAEQLSRPYFLNERPAPLVPTKSARVPRSANPSSLPALQFQNGLGGFSEDGCEYVVRRQGAEATPAPWVNVLANPAFGSLLSESGSSYTWMANAQLFRLTPWHNDPVMDSSGEAIFLRDEESGHFWSPTSLPCPDTAAYVTRHGFGYSVFEHIEDGISTELTVFVAIASPVKFSLLKVRNLSGEPRRLSVTGYVEWVLGDMQSKSAPHVTTQLDDKDGAMLAINSYQGDGEFDQWTGFFDVEGDRRSVSGDRVEFLGRNGTLRDPAAMHQASLSGSVGAAMAPCSAIRVQIELPPGKEREVIFRLGAGTSPAETSALAARTRGAAAHAELANVTAYWKQKLTSIQVRSSDPATDLLVNGWLLYQTLACRVFARSGFYQSGGAIGFRDQLQDVLALVHAEPDLVRKQILLCASRQFAEGDVQHWWHPPAGRGVRTHCSDDYLWLPLAVARYVSVTGDTGVLDEHAPFLEGRFVNAGEDSYYDLPRTSDESASVYQHCVRSILRGLNFGVHGLPLMGTGDWNDGMNLVGAEGKGESVWLAFFLHQVLQQFAHVAEGRDDVTFAERCRAEAGKLALHIEEHAWDGAWYRRAYFDNGTPLGSRESAECKIDSVAQSWSVLSGAAGADRRALAMDSAYQQLVHRNPGVVQLFDPPFDKSQLDPGYIRGYVPGVRENGGQYTHAAIWLSMAFAEMGDTTRAWELADLINPINHGRTPSEVATYRIEPYVVAADVYAMAPHTGRGGWSWYTGSAGWMYRLYVESLFGITKRGDKLYIQPRARTGGPAWEMRYRFKETIYEIRVAARDGSETVTSTLTLDGVVQRDGYIPLSSDGAPHVVEVVLGA